LPSVIFVRYIRQRTPLSFISRLRKIFLSKGTQRHGTRMHNHW